METKLFQQWLFRFGKYAHVDFNPFKRLIPGPKKQNVLAAVTDIDHIRTDFFRKCMGNPGLVYSMRQEFQAVIEVTRSSCGNVETHTRTKPKHNREHMSRVEGGRMSSVEGGRGSRV